VAFAYFRNSHHSDAFVVATVDGTPQVFTRRMLSGRARQAIWLKRIHQYFSLEPYAAFDGDELEMLCLFQATRESHGITGGAAPQMSHSILFNQFVATNITYRARQRIIDIHRWSFHHFLATSGQTVHDNVSEFTQEYDMMVPAVVGLFGLESTSISFNACEIFTRIEYEWVDVTLGEMAALQFDWGLDPIDFDRET